jgi:acetyl-CoA carboxylase carboxyl transferase subunit alpha
VDNLNPGTEDLTALQRVQLARHPERPHTLDFIEKLFDDFTELHGDRRFSDDPAMVCGFAHYKELPVAVIGHQRKRHEAAPPKKLRYAETGRVSQGTARHANRG